MRKQEYETRGSLTVGRRGCGFAYYRVSVRRKNGKRTVQRDSCAYLALAWG